MSAEVKAADFNFASFSDEDIFRRYSSVYTLSILMNEIDGF
jgi:hypothetical protein